MSKQPEVKDCADKLQHGIPPGFAAQNPNSEDDPKPRVAGECHAGIETTPYQGRQGTAFGKGADRNDPEHFPTNEV